MARPLRIEFPGAVYHITSRGNERKEIFRDDHDREDFLNILQRSVSRYHWLCHAYCLMDNHYHLLIETPDGNLSIGMRQLNGVYTQRFNKRQGRAGHLFQGRYKAVLVQKDSHLLEVCRYMALNPVRAGIVKSPEEWIWSSYLATAGWKKPHSCLETNWILKQFASERKVAEKAYRKFVREGAEAGSIWEKVRAQSVFGEDTFMESLTEYIKRKKEIPEISKSQRFMNRPPLKDIFIADILKDKRERNEKIIEAVDSCGYTQREVADYLGIHFTSVSRIMRGMERMLKK